MAAVSAKMKGDVGASDSMMTYQDQEKINLFARRNAQLTELVQEMDERKKELQSIQDAEEELMLGDDSQPILYKIGEVFISLPVENSQDYLEEMKKSVNDNMQELAHKVDEVKKSMDVLKADLYAKFGDNINLEAD